MPYKTLILLLFLTLPSVSAAEDPLDLVLAGGTIYNGDGNPGRVADVGIRDDRIVGVGDLSGLQAEMRLDVSGLAVTPGFIDIHSHAVRDTVEKSGLFRWPDAENYIRQGVTTAIGGPDGSSWYPVSDLWSLLEDAPSSVNFGTFVGHNTVRALAMGRADRAPTAEELQAMKSMVDTAMIDGAYGLSSGLKYIPGAYSEIGEVIELARVAGRHGGIYITHMREEGVGLVDSVQETIRIGEEGGLPAQVTHHKAMGKLTWGKSAQTLALIDAANARGLDVSSDQYPRRRAPRSRRASSKTWSMTAAATTRRA
jgi:dihydroorotase/N-acyl-D-amino-acid deacylase